MIKTTPRPVHPRHAELVEIVEEYLAAVGQSARWLGLKIAKDARLLPNFKRGQQYPAGTMVALYKRLVAFYEQELEKEQPGAT